jgi:hypothetical protein
MIDGRDQRMVSARLALVEYRVLPTEKRVSAADVDRLLYEGVQQMRSIAMTPEYVLDVFQVDCGKKKSQIDWIVHVMNERASLVAGTDSPAAEAEPFKLPDQGAWRWLRNATSFEPTDQFQLEYRNEDGRLRLHMLDDDFERAILCGYPATDEEEARDIPMLIVRKQAAEAVFAAVWLIGDEVEDVIIEHRPNHEDQLVYRVTVNGRSRTHLIPLLSSVE